VYQGATAPVNKAAPKVTKAPRPLPGEEYETAKPLPPVEEVVQELPPASDEPLLPAEPQSPVANQPVSDPEPPIADEVAPETVNQF
jgi:monofunctional biosynthetic peptidoglycan transglycosylase